MIKIKNLFYLFDFSKQGLFQNLCYQLKINTKQLRKVVFTIQKFIKISCREILYFSIQVSDT